MLLSLDTCGSHGSVALGRLEPEADEAKILAIVPLAGRTYSAQLVAKIGEMLSAQQATMQEVEAIVVVNGPGSFTGIRVGLSAAKGLSEATGAPLIAVSRLALLAQAGGLPHVLAVLDAGRGEFYAGEYREGQNQGEMLLSGPDVVAAAIQSGAKVIACEVKAGALDAIHLALDPVGLIDVRPPPDAAAALQYALGSFRARRFEDVETLDANYLRRADAEMVRASRGAAAAR